ncbi:MAG: alpha/beta hydrolase [Candidatus Freyrarchaeum guaymaensis]
MRKWLAAVLLTVVVVGGVAGGLLLSQTRAKSSSESLYWIYLFLLTRKPGYVEFYSYDSNQPLNKDLTLVSVNTPGGYNLSRVYFDSVNGERVSAWMVAPFYPQEGVGVILLHGLRGNKNKTLPLAEYFAAHNFTCLALDLPRHGERAEGPIDLESDFVDIMIQTVFDVRRSIDLLEESFGAERVAVVGRSLGSLAGAVSLGVDGRITVGALIATGGNLTYILHESVISNDIDVNKILSDGRLGYVEPLNYIGNFNGSLQLHYGEDDEVIPPPACTMLYDAAVNCKSRVKIAHSTGHNIPDKEVDGDILNLLRSELTATGIGAAEGVSLPSCAPRVNPTSRSPNLALLTPVSSPNVRIILPLGDQFSIFLFCLSIGLVLCVLGLFGRSPFSARLLLASF